MDLEKLRIKTKDRHDFVPLNCAKTKSLGVKLPTSLMDEISEDARNNHGDSRFVGCMTGWALNELGVTRQALAATADPVAVVRKRTSRNVSPYLFSDVMRHNDEGHLKSAYQALKKDLEEQRSLLDAVFGAGKVSALRSKVNAALARYNAQKPAARPVYRR